MKRQLLILSAMAMALACLPISAAGAGNGVGRGHGGARASGGPHGHGSGHRQGFGKGHGRQVRHGFGHGFEHGLGFGGVFVDDGTDFAELYRELLDNVPYFALHPPVYYSYPVPRTYGYSPFAYPPGVMTPELAAPPQPVTIINPYVPKAEQKASIETTDRSARAPAQPEPLVIINPYVRPNQAVARSEQ
jgi:hypothetical protein